MDFRTRAKAHVELAHDWPSSFKLHQQRDNVFTNTKADTERPVHQVIVTSVVPVNKQFQRSKTVFDWLITVYFLTVTLTKLHSHAAVRIPSHDITGALRTPVEKSINSLKVFNYL
jgi:hypothetical protein